jgi:5-methylcytosine-specific restriction endonuclease McrA
MVRIVVGYLLSLLTCRSGYTSFADFATTAAPRSKEWPRVRDEFLSQEPCCRVCGAKNGVEVHHIEPFHLKPELELDPANLMPLCREHHLWFGHLGRWSSWNADVRADASEWHLKIRTRP